MEKEEAYVLMMEAFDTDADKAGASYHCVCTGKEDTIVPQLTRDVEPMLS